VDRSELGTWGLGLEPADFARAFAALGTLRPYELQHEKVHVDDQIAAALARDPVEWDVWSPRRLWWDGPPPAEYLAQVWSEAVAAREAGTEGRQRPLRFEVALGRSEPWWVLRQLAHPATGIEGLYVREYLGAGRVGWTWPLQVGLLDDEGSAHLADELRADTSVLGRTCELVELGPETPSCDLLLLPFGPRDGLRALLAHDVTASCLAFLRAPAGLWDRTHALVRAAQDHVLAGGTTFAPVPEGAHGRWLDELVTGLGEDLTLDVALRRSTRRFPLVLASRELIAETRLSRLAETLRAGLTARAEETITFARPPEELVDVEIDEAVTWLDEARFAAEMPPERLAEAVPEAMAAIAERPEARFVQARVFDLSTSEAEERRGSLIAGRPHAVSVRIGPTDREWVSAPEEFPDRTLPAGRSHTLTIAFVPLTDAGVEAQSQEVVLPPSGWSSEGEFVIRPSGEELTARVIVVHGNRVLQTALLRAPVVDGEEPAVVDEGVRVETETVVRVETADLHERVRFGATLVLNHDDEGAPATTVIRNQSVTVVEPSGFDDAVDEIRGMLADATESVDGYDELGGSDTIGLLRNLADQGVTLFNALTDDPQFEAIKDEPRIQVVSTRHDAYFPAEFVYAGIAPDDDAGLCSNAEAALAEGDCPNCLSRVDGSVVCPLSFWGLSKVIERHLEAARDESGGVPGWQYQIRNEPRRGRRQLSTTGAALFAASELVDAEEPDGTATVLAALSDATGSPAQLTQEWDRWRAEVAESHPVLLVLLPHTFRHESSVPVMEIEEAERLKLTKVTHEYVRAPDADAPIALLLGCKTADLDLSEFQRLSAAFRRGGAGIVVATLTRVLGRQAAPVASRLVGLLVQYARVGGSSFGDVMLAARREIVRDGRPLAMALVAYGDADWSLRTQSAPSRRRSRAHQPVPA
jgi:hypothetical protein